MGTEKAGDLGFSPEEWERVYAELHEFLVGRRRRKASDLSAGATDLLHDVLLRCLEQPNGRTAVRERGLAAYVFDQVVRDHVQHRDAEKRGGGWRRVTLSSWSKVADGASTDDGLDVEEIAAAMAALERADRDAHRVAAFKLYSTLTIDEMAEALGVSPSKVKQDWRFARAFLDDRLTAQEGLE